MKDSTSTAQSPAAPSAPPIAKPEGWPGTWTYSDGKGKKPGESPAPAAAPPKPPPTATPKATAAALLAKGLWPTVIYAGQKRPIGEGWGERRLTLAEINAKFSRNPDAGVGVCLGPGRGPGDAWMVDIEGDGPLAEESARKLFGGDPPVTMSWSSKRSPHRVFKGDGDRLLEMLVKAGAKEGTGIKAGVHHLEALPDLEFRVGGVKPDGAVKQVQSVCPPTPGDDGQPREWINGPDALADLPEAAYAVLGELAEQQAEQHVDEPHNGKSNGKPHGPSPWTMKATVTGAAAEWFKAVLTGEAEKVANTPEGRRHEQLLASANTLGGQIHLGYLTEQDIRSALTMAGEACGLPRQEIDDVIGDGLEYGKAHPLPWPDKLANPSSNGDGHKSPDTFTNFKAVTEGDKQQNKALSIAQIDEQLRALGKGWPKRINETLFVGTSDYKPVYLNTAARLMAWLDAKARVAWTKGISFITQERFYEHQRMTAEQYDAIETLPHWPRLPRIYYLHRPVGASGGALGRLIDFFSPDSTLDRELIKAMILTAFWGGPPGGRPAFLITGPDRDREQGRGLGKTKLVDIIAEELAGGYVDVSPTDSIADVKTRLLSTEEGRKRVVRLDNVKTLKFSWADLEGLITSSEISGRALYVGEGRRPNILVWMITLNGASMSKDMAQRSIVIKLGRPTFRPTWESEVREFIRANLWGLLGDIKALLETPPSLTQAKTRWAAWEGEVLSKVGQCSALQQVIVDRQKDIDDDDDERDHMIEFFRTELERRGHEPDVQTVLIPSVVAAEWVSDATRTPYPTNRASAFIAGLSIPQLRKSDRGKIRGWVWIGEESEDKEARKLGDPPAWEMRKRR